MTSSTHSTRPASVTTADSSRSSHERRNPGRDAAAKNIYVLDRTTGQMTQESIRPDGTPSNGDSQAPSLSSNGRIIAFETVAGNLGTGDTGFSQNHIVVRDRETGAVRTLAGNLGQPPHGETSQPVVSADGAVVAFTSDGRIWCRSETRTRAGPMSICGDWTNRGSSASASTATAGSPLTGPATPQA